MRKFDAKEESLPNRYSTLSLAHVCACVTGFQHSELYRFGRFAAKDFTFYTSLFWVNLSHFRIIRKSASSLTPIHKILCQAKMEW